METWRNAWLGWRRAVRSPRFSGAVLVLLGLGVGAASAGWSVYRNVVLHPLPFAHDQELVEITATEGSGGEGPMSPPDFLDYRAQERELAGVAGFYPNDATLTGHGPADHVNYANVAAGFFETLEVKPARGRGITAADEQANLPEVAVLGDGLWRERFGGDPGILGRTMQVDGRPITVIGVMPPGFDYPEHAQFWMPEPFANPLLQARQSRFLTVIGRLAPGASVASGGAELAAIAAGLARSHPDTNRGVSMRMTPLAARLAAPARPAVLWLLAATLLVLALTCANVANLMFLQALARRQEAAIRVSLGASPWQVAAPLAWECLPPLLAGGVLGWLAAGAALRAAGYAGGAEVGEAALALAAGSGLLCAAAPAGWLAWSAHTGPGAPRWTRSALTVAEIAMATAVLAVGGLLWRSQSNVQRTALGFDPAGVVTFRVSVPASSPADVQRGAAFFEQLQPALAQLPGVAAAGLISTLPLAGRAPRITFSGAGIAAVSARQRPVAEVAQITPGYFAGMGIRVLRGREFTAADDQHAGLVAVISETLARRYYAGSDPVGRVMVLNLDTRVAARIVGVAEAVRTRTPWTPPAPAIYLPFAQDPVPDMFAVVRAGVGTPALLAAARAQVAKLDPDIPVYSAATMADRVAEADSGYQWRSRLAAAFALLALTLAGAGVYSLTAMTVEQQRREIGIRMALGASPRNVGARIAGRALRLGGVGAVIGLAAAWPAGQLLGALVYGIAPRDPGMWLGAAGLVLAVTGLASQGPARRASRMNPAAALRQL